MTAPLTIRPADNARLRRRFAALPAVLYRDDPCWTPPLAGAQARLLAGKTAFFDHGEMALFLAERSGRAVGRIAAIHNRAHARRYADGVGFFGFFECDPQDAQAAAALLGEAERWLLDRGLSRLRGPVNPSMNAECGLLIDGFDRPAMALMPHNPPAYADLLQAHGLVKCKDLYAYLVDAERVRPGTAAGDRLIRLADAVRRRHPELRVRELDMRDYLRDVGRVLGIFEQARSGNWGYVPLTDAETRQTAVQMKRVVDPRLVLLAEVDGEPAGAILAIPNINRALAAVNGRLWPFGFLRFFRELRRVTEMRVFGVATLERFRPMGVTGLLFIEEILRGLAAGIRTAEVSWVLEDNRPSDTTIRNALDPRLYKTYRLYEKPLTPQGTAL